MSETLTQKVSLQGLEPVFWQGQAVCLRYSLLKNHLRQNLGEEFAAFFSEPFISEENLKNKSSGIWRSEIFSDQAKPISEFEDEERARYENILQSKLDTLLAYAQQLVESEDIEDNRWGQVIFKAVEIPSIDFVYGQNDDVVLIGWGFNKEENKKQAFSLRNTYPPIHKVDSTPDKNVSSQTESEENAENSQDELEEEKARNSSINDNKGGNHTQSSSSHKNKKKLRFILLLLLGILLIAFLFFIFNRQKSYIPSEPNVIVPIDSTEISLDPDSISYISAERLNIAIGNQEDLKAFAKRFKQLFPQENYQVIYYDTLSNFLQVEVPANEREQVKKRLETEIKEFELIIFYEGIFQNNYLPSDPEFNDNRKRWYHERVRVLEAWDISMGDSNLVVAVIDDGFDVNHPEFDGKIFNPWNVFSRSPNIIMKQNTGHGTHVAGTAVGGADNNHGVSGIAPNCKLMPVQVGDWANRLSTTAVIEGFLYAMHQGAHVINLSLGLKFSPSVSSLPPTFQRQMIQQLRKEEEKFWDRLFKMAYDKGIIVVLAGGNQDIMIGLDPMQRSQYTIRVSATGIRNEKAFFSNYGNHATLSAPGVQIYNSLPVDNYDFMDGTSMAAPIVTGGVALMKSVNPTLGFQEIVDILQSTGIPVSSPTKYVGNIIQLSDAVKIAKQKRDRTPQVDCPEIQTRIDSLLKEIEKIRQLCPEETATDTLKIPTKNNDLSFAEGRWKSTTYIYNNEGEKVTIYFDFFADATGKVTLIEADNTSCESDLSLTLQNGQFEAEQLASSPCVPPPTVYSPYHFSCEPDSQGYAICRARNKTNKSNDFMFRLIKLR